MESVGQREDDWANEGISLNIGSFASGDAWNYENGFNYTSHYSRTAKLITHWEIYKKIENVPGDIFELGVYKLGSFLRWATFREVNENAYSRKLVGFDAFGEFPRTGSSNDISFAKDHDNQDEDKIEIKEAMQIMSFKGFRNFDLIKGDVGKTLSIYLEKNPHTRIALLHLDMDVYVPTKHALDLLWDRLVKGGVLIIDDYASVEGASLAVDEFLSCKGKDQHIERLKFHPTPSFIIKS